ncbi:hydantoinase B/oxoprolinase family protein [Hoeflea alexandrii]|uniref:hydantoinase B/oxoprolinase family protein n=1 Tax=Hoeflea alexandrii TaxID=288436 RepID=UPI0022B004B5|nr:hydantoinase B/oxoprolinase family protein [Hoeflea alexandrii]MCZ4291989.1 hydantoinase B/oxoprolinase family protein [Hoeflea alexandrii]
MNKQSLLNAIDIQIQWNRMISMMDEADVALLHSSFSTVVSDSRDYAVILLDSKARSIAQAQICVPAFTSSLPAAARKMLEEFPLEELQPGDVLFTNDPWICHGHLPDFYVIVPIFNEGRVIAFYAGAAHVSDVGGRIDELTARDVYEEGLRIPPVKLYEAGIPNAVVFKILRANTRYPRLVLGDLGALVGAGDIVARRCREFEADYGAGGIDRIGEEILKRSENAMRQAIAALPDGDYPAAIDVDGYQTSTHIALSVCVRGDEIKLDYAGSSPQRADASINCVSNVTHAHSMFAVKCLLARDIPNNEGLFRPVRTVAPEGSILNAKFPAPVRGRSMTSYHLHSVIFEAMADLMPAAVQAGSGSFWWISCAGQDSDGEPFGLHVLPNGGVGATDDMDGHPVMAFPGNGTFTPIEIIEHRSPLMILERSLRVDSGGAGRKRGGLGQVIRIRTHGAQNARMTLRPDKLTHPARGIQGGEPGAKGEVWLDDKALPLEPFVLNAGQILTLKLPGGGGFGAPTDRDPQDIARDIANGYISTLCAVEIYGVARKAH